MNETKTEKYEIKRNGHESWKECKLLISLLDPDKDISRTKSLAIDQPKS